MPILKPIDETYNCVVNPQTPDDLLKYVLGTFNDMLYIETDNNGSQLQPQADKFFAVNRLLAFGPVQTTDSSRTANKYSRMSYDCLLTIAKPSDARQEIENTELTNVGQFDAITSQFLGIDFPNTFRKYFTCCGQEITAPRIRPVWNVNTYMLGTNYTGVEITFTLTI
jgi:hypothetical protein